VVKVSLELVDREFPFAGVAARDHVSHGAFDIRLGPLAHEQGSSNRAAVGALSRLEHRFGCAHVYGEKVRAALTGLSDVQRDPF
jgi:hypothetical protein